MSHDDAWLSRSAASDREIENVKTPGMTPPEAVMLCRYAKACCPQQQFDAYTPDAWFDLLGDLPFAECKEAIANVTKKQPFVSPAEIRQAVKGKRAHRMEEFERRYRVTPPAELAEDPDAEMRWVASWRSMVMSGEVTHPDQIAGSGPNYQREVGKGIGPDPDVIAKLRATLAESRAAEKPTPTYEPAPRMREAESDERKSA